MMRDLHDAGIAALGVIGFVVGTFAIIAVGMIGFKALEILENWLW